jgi:hypothetical protein
MNINNNMKNIKLFEDYNVDKILDKISANGIESLTSDDKRYLGLHSKDSISEDESDDMENIQNKMANQELIKALKENDIINDSMESDSLNYEEDYVEVYDVFIQPSDELSNKDEKIIKSYFMDNYFRVELHGDSLVFHFEDYGEDIDDEERSVLMDYLINKEIHYGQHEFIFPQFG